MKNLIQEVKLKNERYAEHLPYGLDNFTHCEFNAGGVILISNKNFESLKKVKLFIPYEKIEFISLLNQLI